MLERWSDGAKTRYSARPAPITASRFLEFGVDHIVIAALSRARAAGPAGRLETQEKPLVGTYLAGLTLTK